MQTKWIKGLTKQQEKDLKLQLEAARGVLKRLTELLEEDINSIRNSQESNEQYNCPNWAMKHADFIGELRAYNKIIRLIDIKEIKHVN